MRLPISAKTLFRLHRKLFMIRTPRLVSDKSYCLTFFPGGKSPGVCLQVENRRQSLMGFIFVAVVMVLTAWRLPQRK